MSNPKPAQPASSVPGQSVQTMQPDTAEQVTATSGGATSTNTAASGLVSIYAVNDCWYDFGDSSPVTVNTDGTSHFVASGERITPACPPGSYVGLRRVGSDDVTVYLSFGKNVN